MGLASPVVYFNWQAAGESAGGPPGGIVTSVYLEGGEGMPATAKLRMTAADGIPVTQ